MTVYQEARQVAEVLATADGGCPVCTRRLAEEAQARWPELDWPALVEAVREPASPVRRRCD